MHAELAKILKALSAQEDERTVRDFLGLVAAATGDEGLARLPPVRAFVDEAARVGGLERYFETHPLPQALLDAVRRLASAAATDVDARGHSGALDRVIGSERAALPSSSTSAPPAGSVRGGVFARVVASKRST